MAENTTPTTAPPGSPATTGSGASSDNLLEMMMEQNPAHWAAYQISAKGRGVKTVGEAMEMIQTIVEQAIGMALQPSDELLGQIWNHMHGVNMDGSRRIGAYASTEAECARNWQRLSDAVGRYLEPEPPNENKMSDGGRERAPLEVKVWKSC